MQWLDGDETRRNALLGAVARLQGGDGVTWLRAREGRRRLARVALPGGGACFAKHYLRGDRHRLREWWKRRLRLTTAEREWRTGRRLFAAGIPVPEPLAHVRLDSGERVVLTAWVEGTPLGDAIPASPRERRAGLAAVGALVRGLHTAGWVHRDLHGENVLVGEAGPVLIDLQAARRSRRRAARRRDLGRLDFSLRRALSLPDRLRLRAAALGVARPFDDAARAALRAVGRASLERERIHAASRARRSLRAGRRARRLAWRGGRGLVSREADEDALRAALAGDAAAGAGVVLRHYPGHLGELFRGSAARRAWTAAHALEASDIPCAVPLAFLEWRRFGAPAGSLLALEDETACAAPPHARAALERSLRSRLAESGFRLRGGEGDAIFVARRGGEALAAVSGLERVRPSRRR